MSEKLDLKIRSHEFDVVTKLTPEQIKAASARAAQSAKRTMGSSVKETGAGADSLTYAIKGPGGLVTLMDMQVKWAAADDGYRVSLHTGGYTTTRPTLLSVIPIGPKDAPALKSLDRYSAWMRKELAG